MSELIDNPRTNPYIQEEELTLRKNAPQYLKSALKLGILPAATIQEARIFNLGVQSVVYKVSGDQGTFVVKMRQSPGVLESEAAFFKEWSRYGVKTPQVLNLHKANEELPTSILVMEYIDAPVVSEAMKVPEFTDKGLAREMGRILACIHRAKGKGFGKPIAGNPKQGVFSSFTEQIENTLFKSRIQELLAAKLVNEEEVNLARQSMAMIENDMRERGEPSLIHYDVTTPHLFYTQPLTVYDPVGLISHPVFCLSMSIFRMEQYLADHPKEDTSQVVGEIVKGYREEGQTTDKLIAAGVILNALMVMSSVSRRDEPDKLEKTEKIKEIIQEFHL